MFRFSRQSSIIAINSLSIALFLFFSASASNAECSVDRDWLRAEFRTAKESGPGVLRLLEQIRSKCDDMINAPVITRSYYGGLLTLEAKYSHNPVRKMSAFNEGMAIMDKAVADPEADIEVFFMRFAALHSMPSFLSNRDKRRQDQDKVCLLLQQKDYRIVNKAAQKDIIMFMLNSDRLTREQNQTLKQLQAEVPAS